MKNSILSFIGMILGVAACVVMVSNYATPTYAKDDQVVHTTVSDEPVIVITSETDAEEETTATMIYEAPVQKVNDEAPRSEALDAVMSRDLQEYIYSIAVSRYPDPQQVGTKKLYYASMIGLAQGESEFRSKCKNSNNNGTTDRGLYQTNSCWIKTLKKLGYISSSEDLYDPYVSAKCGDYVWWQCWSQFGWDEKSYGVYLYGKPHKNNKWTARVWNMQKNWYEELYGKEER